MLVGTSLAAHGAVLSQYTFGATNASPTFAATTVDGGFTASNVTATTNAGPAPGTVFSFQVNTGNYPNPALQVNTQNGNTTAALAVTNGAFFTFTLTPNAGTPSYDLTSLTFDAARGGAGTPRGYVVRSSRDSFGSDLAAADVPTARPTLTPVTVPLTGAAFTGLTTATTFRIYTYAPSEGTSVEYDNITINGTVIPEPSTALLGALGALCLLRRKR